MGRGILAGVFGCALASQVFGAAYLFEGGRYEQDFEGLQWESTATVLFSSIGQSSTGTSGWSVTGGSGRASSLYSSRIGTNRPSGTSSGAPVIPSGATSLSDKSLARSDASSYSYVNLHLYNNSTQTFDVADVGYTLEAWMKPTTAISASSGLRLYRNVGVLPYADSNPNAGLTLSSATQLDAFTFSTSSAVGTESQRSLELTNLDWDPGETLVLTWYYPSTLYNGNHFYGLDDVSVVVPEPSVVMMATGVVMAALSLRRRAVA